MLCVGFRLYSTILTELFEQDIWIKFIFSIPDLVYRVSPARRTAVPLISYCYACLSSCHEPTQVSDSCSIVTIYRGRPKPLYAVVVARVVRFTRVIMFLCSSCLYDRTRNIYHSECCIMLRTVSLYDFFAAHDSARLMTAQSEA